MLHHKNIYTWNQQISRFSFFGTCWKNLQKNYGAIFHVLLFRKIHLPSTYISTTYFAQLQNQCPYANVEPANRRHPLSWLPSQRIFMTDITSHHHIHLPPRQEKYYLRLWSNLPNLLPLTCICHKPKFILPSNFSIPNFIVAAIALTRIWLILDFV